MARPIFPLWRIFRDLEGDFPASLARLLPPVGISSHSNEFEFPEKYAVVIDRGKYNRRDREKDSRRDIWTDKGRDRATGEEPLLDVLAGLAGSKYICLEHILYIRGAFKIKLQSVNNMNMAVVRNELTFNCLSAFTRTNQACHSKCSIYLL